MQTYYFVIIVYLLIVNITAFCLMGYDKRCARQQKRRIRERTLLLWCVVGGSIGGLLGMKGFHHKTRHKKFTIGIHAILLIHIFIIAYLTVLK